MACFRIGPDGAGVCAIVCDGAGSAEFGGEGAWIACRTLKVALRQHFQSRTGLPSDDDVWILIDLTRDRLGQAAEKRARSRKAFASTLLVVAEIDGQVLTVHVGDGAVVGRSVESGWVTLSHPENGEYASATYFLTDDPLPKLRISRPAGEYSGFAVFSDGIENLALDLHSNEPFGPFFEKMLKPLDDTSGVGRSANLSHALGEFLGSSRVCERTDDDKTLVLISA